MPHNCLLAALLFLVMVGCQPDLPVEVDEAMALLPAELDYNQHVKPVLSDKCFACHGPDKAKQKAGLRLDIAENAYDDLPESPGKVAIDPGSLSKSEVVRRILSSDPDQVMPIPKSNLSLTAYEKAVLVKWIQQGAEYKPHWAFVKPEMPDIPVHRQRGLGQKPHRQFYIGQISRGKTESGQRSQSRIAHPAGDLRPDGPAAYTGRN